MFEDELHWSSPDEGETWVGDYLLYESDLFEECEVCEGAGVSGDWPCVNCDGLGLVRHDCSPYVP